MTRVMSVFSARDDILLSQLGALRDRLNPATAALLQSMLLTDGYRIWLRILQKW